MKEKIMEGLRFKIQSRQGDVFFRRVDKIPDGAKKASIPDNGKYVLGHSETGHPHTMLAEDVEVFYVDDPLLAYVRVKKQDAPLVHEKTYDIHETFLFDEGTFEFRNQREHTPQGFRRVVD